MNPLRLASTSDRGYLLLEVIIAITIFSLSFVGLMRVLRQSQDAASQFAFETHVRFGLDSLLAEVRNRPIEEMAREETDSLLGVVYQTEVEPLSVSNEEGVPLTDLYCLRAWATYNRGQGDELEVAEIWIYRPEEEEP